MRFHVLLFFALARLTGYARAADAPVAPDLTPPSVKLAVIISIDQMRADYLVRFRPYFADGGFKRLLEGGADFQNTHYRHALTQTAPGHATIATGVHANIHGITSNEWVDLDSWEIINNVEDRAAPLVGLPSNRSANPLPARTGRSPRNLRVSTIGDQLKLRFGTNSKVFSAANKDRSAILLGGKLGDAAYWDESGQMVTSAYYRDALPAWIAAFNAEHRAEAAFGKIWDRLLPTAVYDRVQGPDDAPGESDWAGFNRTFPKKMDGGESTLTENFFNAFDRSPFSAEFLGAFVQRALREEQLGRHAATDLLCVGFSQLDELGHGYGPDSHEVMDLVLRMDRVMAELLGAIDREVGLQHCVMVLTADHGIPPMPERVHALRPEIPAGRIEYGVIDRAVRSALDAAFGALPEGEYWFRRYNNGYHLRPSALAARKVALTEVARIVKQAVQPIPFIAQVFTRDEILAAEPEGDSMLAMVRRSYYAARDRDVVFIVQPYFFIQAFGSNHGAPYDYDTHVPQVWFGAGVPRGVHVERVGVDDLVPTLAGLLGVPAPPHAMGRRLF